MKKIFFTLLAVSLLTACKESVKISGKIGCANRQTIYVEHVGLKATEIIDSVKTGKDGGFKVRIEPSHYPDLFRVRMGKQFVLFSLDSASTDITITVPDSSFQYAQIDGSEASADIQKLRLSHHNLQQYAFERNIAAVDSALKNHQSMAEEIILKNPRSMAAYYAINQTFNGNYYFNPYEKHGLQFWSAVATSFDIYYPDYERTIEMKEITLDAIRQKRSAELNVNKILETANEVGFIEISLPGKSGKNINLSSLTGKTVLIDFSAYAMEQASAHTLFLRELYSKYHQYGFEIYQVSLDPSRLQWQEQSKSIPWVCVHDERSTDSPYLMTYNVSEIPTFFLMDRQGNILGRYNHESIEQAIDQQIVNR